MLSLLNLVYTLPVLIALIVAGALVNPRVTGPARTLMWTGIVLECLARLAAMLGPYLVTSRAFAQLYPALNLTIAVLGGVGVVLLVVAVGAAARGPRPTIGIPDTAGQGWPDGRTPPGQPQSFGPQPDQSGGTGWAQGPSGQPVQGAHQPGAHQPGAHQSGGYQPGGQGNPTDPPGQWTAPGQWGNQP